MDTNEIKVLPYAAVAGDSNAAADIDQVFFSSSNTTSFASDAERSAFRERWLGRYLMHFPHLAFVAVTRKERVAGYLVGSPKDPARDPLFADLPHFQNFAQLTPAYPAQLHVNLDEAWRGQSVGSALIEAFVAKVREDGAPGVHVVTSRGARNVRFYAANGFVERGAARVREDAELVFLGRNLRNDGRAEA